MKVVLGILVAVLMVPVLLLLAVAAGPVVLAILCAVGFGLIVFVVANILLGVGLMVEHAGWRLTRGTKSGHLHP